MFAAVAENQQNFAQPFKRAKREVSTGNSALRHALAI
jgi:hypothetical protein